MDPFEEQLRNLPWRKPSTELRKRLFVSSEEETVVRGTFGNWVPLAWAAAFLVVAGLITYTLGPVADAPTGKNPLRVVSADIQPLEIASSQSFFDFSRTADDPWAGPLSLQVEPN